MKISELQVGDKLHVVDDLYGSHKKIQTLSDSLRRFRYEVEVMPFCFLKCIRDTSRCLQIAKQIQCVLLGQRIV